MKTMEISVQCDMKAFTVILHPDDRVVLVLTIPNNQTIDRKLKNTKTFLPLVPDVHPKMVNHHVEHPSKWLSLQSTRNQQKISVQ